MKKKKLGNDIRFAWHIIDDNGHPFNLEEKDLTLTILGPVGQVPYGDKQIEGNTISFTFYGKDQTAHGKYAVILSENAGAEDMKTVDFVDAVELVEHTIQEGGQDNCSHLTTETVNLESAITVGVPGPRGFSLYDYAVKYYGFAGTEREFWLWYKQAKDDADTAAGNAAAAQESIEASERERAAEFARLAGLIKAAVANADSLVNRLRTFPTVFVDELPEASVSTQYSFYLVPNPSDQTVKDIYLTEKKQDGTYGWRKVGGTRIDFQDYVRKEDIVLLTEDEYEALRDPDPDKYYLTYEDDWEEEE